MAQSVKSIGVSDEALVQASFDFLPQEMRLRRRYGAANGMEAARRRAQLRLVDQQASGLGSRIVAARLREILKPNSATSGEISADALVAARAELREIGNAVFYFSQGDEETAPADQQPLHPRPLPTRYFGT